MTDVTDLFPGFDSHWVDTDVGRIFARVGGNGPPLLLLHGFPQTHVMWHRLAPELSRHFSVVAMDLRGYGWSVAPQSKNGELYTKREMGRDVVTVMEDLGHVRFRICGHDRGGRVGYRLALDHPGHVEKLALLDILPTSQVWKNIREGGTPAAHWAFLSQREPVPETEIKKGPDAYFEGLITGWTQEKSLRCFDARALRQYRDAWGDPSRIHAMCEDYRAGARQDLEADEADLAAGRTIGCPTLVLSGDFFLTRGTGPSGLSVWQQTLAPQAQGGLIDAGHFIAEENPTAVLDALLAFL